MIKILAFILMLADWVSCTVLAVRNCCLYTEELAYSWCRDHLCKYNIYCSVGYESLEIFI